MKKTYEFYAILGLQVLLILMLIYKESSYVAAIYEQQKIEQKKAGLTQLFKKLTCEIQTLKSRKAVERFAHEKLNLQPIALTAVKRLYAQQPTEA